MKGSLRYAAIAAWGLVTPLQAQATQGEPPPVRYRHAYYLFVVGPSSDASDRSIPLLLAPTAIEQVRTSSPGTPCALLWTYERDSLSFVRRDVPVRAQDVRPLERHVEIPGVVEGSARRWYRYQSVPLSEARRLLARPEGAIPVHRRGVAREVLDSLGSALQDGE